MKKQMVDVSVGDVISVRLVENVVRGFPVRTLEHDNGVALVNGVLRVALTTYVDVCADRVRVASSDVPAPVSVLSVADTLKRIVGAMLLKRQCVVWAGSVANGVQQYRIRSTDGQDTNLTLLVSDSGVSLDWDAYGRMTTCAYELSSVFRILKEIIPARAQA